MSTGEEAVKADEVPFSPAENASPTPCEEELRKAYFEYNRSVRVANSKIACMLVVVLMPVGFTLDLFVYPQDFNSSFF